METRAILRILDASANRAAEGLRTIESFARFAVDHEASTALAKELRHQLTEALRGIEPNARLAARDTEGDCGTQLATDSEARRGDMREVLQAAFARVQQSLRTIEEYGKVVSPTLGAAAESIRYQTYTLEKHLQLSAHRRQQLAGTQLYLLVDVQAEISIWLDRIEALARAGVDVIQIRDKHASDRTLYEYSVRAMGLLRSMPHDQRSLLIINDRPDLAVATDADGVHVGQDELPATVARSLVGEAKIVGVSTHSLSQARTAEADGADYIGCGPTFPSQTKSFDQFEGVDFLRAASNAVMLPAFAIGGIDATNLAQVVHAGVRRIAVGAAIWGQPDEAAAAQRLREQLTTLTAAKAATTETAD